MNHLRRTSSTFFPYVQKRVEYVGPCFIYFLKRMDQLKLVSFILKKPAELQHLDEEHGHKKCFITKWSKSRF
jgi:hypothetical protein